MLSQTAGGAHGGELFRLVFTAILHLSLTSHAFSKRNSHSFLPRNEVFRWQAVQTRPRYTGVRSGRVRNVFVGTELDSTVTRGAVAKSPP
jgi:hypothetical protein